MKNVIKLSAAFAAAFCFMAARAQESDDLVFDSTKYLTDKEVISGNAFPDGVDRRVIYTSHDSSTDFVSLSEVRLKSDIPGSKYFFGNNKLYCSLSENGREISKVEGDLIGGSGSLDQYGVFLYPTQLSGTYYTEAKPTVDARNNAAKGISVLWKVCESITKLIKKRMRDTNQPMEKPGQITANTPPGLAGPR